MSYQSKEELVAIFAQAWRTLNPELIVANLDQSFIYDSQWVFESLDYSRYIDYIRGKFHTIKRRNAGVKVEIVPDPYQGGNMLALTQGSSTVFYRIQVKDGKVVKCDLCAF